MAVGGASMALAMLIGIAPSAHAGTMTSNVSGKVSQDASYIVYGTDAYWHASDANLVTIKLTEGVDVFPVNGVVFKVRNQATGLSSSWSAPLNVNFTIHDSTASWIRPQGYYFLDAHRENTCSIACDNTWAGMFTR